MNRVYDDGRAGEQRGHASKHARLGGVGVDDREAARPEHPPEGDECAEVAKRTHLANEIGQHAQGDAAVVAGLILVRL